MEHRCPVNAQLELSLDEQKVTSSSVELNALVKCKHFEEEIGDFFGENPHKKPGEYDALLVFHQNCPAKS